VLLEQLDAFRQYCLSVNTLESVEAGLKVGDVELVCTANGSASTVRNPVVLEIAESDCVGTCRDGRSILRNIYREPSRATRRTRFLVCMTA
jgi:hypothetical protein